MARGMVLDIDHMSQKAADEALALVEAQGYSVICSHAVLRDLAFTADVEFDPANPHDYGTSDARKLPTELGKRADQVERIARLGGVVAPILNMGDIAGLRRVMPGLTPKVPEPCAGSSSSWAQAYLYVANKMGGRGVAMGSDLNGAAGLPAPRFGTFAGYGAHGDAHRTAERRAEIDRQTAGVRYGEPIREYRWFRFEHSGPGAYEDEEREIWEAIAEYKAGFNPWIHEHPEDDLPPERLLTLLQHYIRHRELHRVDHIARGLWAAADERFVEGEDVSRWPVEQRAAYVMRKNQAPDQDDERATELVKKMQAIWDKWEAMNGPNPPLVRCKAGLRRDYDINLDGMAHYGLLPDFLQDVKNLGLAQDDMAPLFRSANDYVEMWNKCASRAKDKPDARQ